MLTFLLCSSTLYLLDGKCVSECGKGFYQDDVGECKVLTLR